MRVLLVEDDAAVRETLRDLLLAAGHTVTAAADFAAGRSLLLAPQYDVLVTDLVLPGGNGIDLARQARAQGAGAVVCTGHPEEHDRLAREGVGHLTKPFSAAALERALAEALARRG
jgi:two-component system nitrogen regulation response regulator GlnG